MRIFTTIITILSLSATSYAQNPIGTVPTIQTGVANTLPTSCTVGQVFFLLTPTVGLYQCLTPNTWTVLSTGSSSPAWSAITSANGDLTLSNTTFNTTISNMASTNFIKHSNVTAATNLGVNQSSPTFNECGNYFTLGASAQDCWNFQDAITAGIVSATVTNVSETSGSVVTLTITGGTNFIADQRVTFTGLTTATWLNAQNALLTTASATSLTFTDPTSHGTQGSAAETGQVTQSNPLSAFTVAHSGSGNGASQTMFQSGEATFIDGTTYPTMNIGQLSVPGRICSTTGAGNYGTGFPAYGFAMHDVCPTLFSKPAPSTNGTGSHSIMGLNVGMATAFPDNNVNVFALNGQLATPSSYAGNQWAWYGMYHESDHNGSGTLHLAYANFGATYNNGNGICSTCVGGHFEAIGNFYGGTNTPTTALNVALECNSGVALHATHTNDYCFHVLTPVTGGTFTNSHYGIVVDDQSANAVISGAIGMQFKPITGTTPSGYTALDLGANTMTVEGTNGNSIFLVQPGALTSSLTLRWPTGAGSLVSSACPGGKVFLSSDFTSANTAGLQAITGLNCSFPANGGGGISTSFTCKLMYSQATPIASDQFGVGTTGTITNFNAWGSVATNTGAATPFTTGTALAIATSTPTAVVTFTPVNTGLNIAEIDGTIEPASASSFQLYVTDGTAADVIVVKRDSYCQFF